LNLSNVSKMAILTMLYRATQSEDSKSDFYDPMSVQSLMEGLLMYLPEEDVIRLLGEISRRFTNSQLVTDAMDKKFSKGFYRKFTKLYCVI